MQVLDFVHDYNAFKGNAYGLANTLMQTAILKPAIKSSKVSNFVLYRATYGSWFGVPPSLISGVEVSPERNFKSIQITDNL